MRVYTNTNTDTHRHTRTQTNRHRHTHLATLECYGLIDDTIFDTDEIFVSHGLVAIRIPEHHILPLSEV